VVPLKDLVEHDAIDEPAEAQAVEQPGGSGGRPRLARRRCHAGAYPARDCANQAKSSATPSNLQRLSDVAAVGKLHVGAAMLA
jgi:hypothetical protein